MRGIMDTEEEAIDTVIALDDIVNFDDCLTLLERCKRFASVLSRITHFNPSVAIHTHGFSGSPSLVGEYQLHALQAFCMSLVLPLPFPPPQLDQNRYSSIVHTRKARNHLTSNQPSCTKSGTASLRSSGENHLSYKRRYQWDATQYNFLRLSLLPIAFSDKELAKVYYSEIKVV